MHIVVTGATGNVGTSVLEALSQDPAVTAITGVARRLPEHVVDKTTWIVGDVASDDLTEHLRGADVLIHLAWLIQPAHDRAATQAVNVEGSRRVFAAAADAGVGAIVHASSVGAYSPGPKGRAVREDWPTDGVRSSFYSRDKADVEHILDGFEREHPQIRVVRLRPGLIFKHEAGAEIRRLFAGPLVPRALLRRERIPVVPDIRGLVFQAVHSRDVGEAYRLAATTDVRGAFNVAADPVLDPAALARLLDARRVRLPVRLVRALADVTWRLRLQPTPPGWLDLALGVPTMDTTRAREELGWQPTHTSEDALLELLHGMRTEDGPKTPPLSPERRRTIGLWGHERTGTHDRGGSS